MTPLRAPPPAALPAHSCKPDAQPVQRPRWAACAMAMMGVTPMPLTAIRIA